MKMVYTQTLKKIREEIKNNDFFNKKLVFKNTGINAPAIKQVFEYLEKEGEIEYINSLKLYKKTGGFEK